MAVGRGLGGLGLAEIRSGWRPKTGIAEVPTCSPGTTRPTIAASWGESAPKVYPNQADVRANSAASRASCTVASTWFGASDALSATPTVMSVRTGVGRIRIPVRV
jgi:hypothetical protein